VGPLDGHLKYKAVQVEEAQPRSQQHSQEVALERVEQLAASGDERLASDCARDLREYEGTRGDCERQRP
jgi:hypothetical protein